MAVISDDTFDPLHRYVRVRLQQGVPIVDADVNEREDIQAFELRAFLKWFVGDGVPEGNDGFRVVGTDAENDFTVTAGFSGTPDALSRIGRCLVQGLDVMIEENVDFTAQPLHQAAGAAADALAATWGVPVIEPLTAPPADGTVLVYLDVWERLVTPAEDDELVHEALGVESCARMKREWVVRVATDDALPDAAKGHAHAPLAAIRRRKGDAVVRPADVIDRRAKRLLLPPATLVEDVLGLAPDDYRAGVGRPPVSLREAVNALLRGELPSTPDAPVDGSESSDTMSRAFLVDGGGGLVAVWSSDRNAPADQIFAARLDLADVPAGFTAAAAVTDGVAHVGPHAALLPGGDLLVVYQSGLGVKGDIAMKRAPNVAALLTAAETTVASTLNVSESTPYLAVIGALVVVFFHRAEAGAQRWHYRLWKPADGQFDGDAEVLSAKVTTSREFHAAVGTDGTVWVAFRAGDDIQALQLNPATGTVAHEETINSGQTDEHPFVLCTRNGDVWVFLRAQTGIWARRFHHGSWEAIAQIVGAPGVVADDRQPCAVEDTEGGIWLLWSSGPTGEGQIVAMRRHPTQEVWGGARVLVSARGDDTAPFALVAPDTAIWLFWTTGRSGSVDIFYKRLVTTV